MRVLPLLLRALLLLLQLRRGTQLPLSCQVVLAQRLPGYEGIAAMQMKRCMQFHKPWNPPVGVQPMRLVFHI